MRIFLINFVSVGYQNETYTQTLIRTFLKAIGSNTNSFAIIGAIDFNFFFISYKISEMFGFKKWYIYGYLVNLRSKVMNYYR